MTLTRERFLSTVCRCLAAGGKKPYGSQAQNPTNLGVRGQSLDGAAVTCHQQRLRSVPVRAWRKLIGYVGQDWGGRLLAEVDLQELGQTGPVFWLHQLVQTARGTRALHKGIGDSLTAWEEPVLFAASVMKNLKALS